MANEAITWPAPPDVTDATDGAQSYNMGRVFTLTADAPVVGVEWRVPDTAPVSPAAGSPAGGVYAVALWNVDTNTRLAYKEVSPTPGGAQQFLFDTPHSGLTTETLQATIYTNHYVYATGDDAGSESPSGTVVAGASRLADYNGGAATAFMPVTPTSLNFYVGPVVEVGEGDHTTTGTAPVEVTSTAAVTTTRTDAGTVPVAATASATSASVRVTTGTAGVATAATSAVTTNRTTAATAAVRLAATAAVTTSRTTAATAAVRVTAGSYSATGAPGPRLVTAPRKRALVATGGPDRIVTRTQVVG